MASGNFKGELVMSSKNDSGYEGVDFHQGKWRARIRTGTSRIVLGRFDTKVEAGQAYAAAFRIANGITNRHSDGHAYVATNARAHGRSDAVPDANTDRRPDAVPDADAQHGTDGAANPSAVRVANGITDWQSDGHADGAADA